MTRLSALLLAPLLCLAARAAPAADATVFAVAHAPLSLPIYVAEAEGYFAAEGVAVRIEDCTFGRACLRQMLDHKAQLCTVAESPIMFASFERAQFAIVATIATNRNDSKIITRESGPIKTASDLDGKRVGTVVGTAANYFLDVVSLLANVDPDRLKVVPVKPEEAAAKLAANEIDAVAIFEPFAYAAAQALGADTRVLVNKRAYTQYWNLVAAHSILPSRDRDVEGILRALDRAMLLIAHDPERAKAILRKRLAMDQAAVDWVWNDLDFGLELQQSVIGGLEAEARWALRNGLVQGVAPNYLNYVHVGPLQRVRADAVTLIQ